MVVLGRRLLLHRRDNNSAAGTGRGPTCIPARIVVLLCAAPLGSSEVRPAGAQGSASAAPTCAHSLAPVPERRRSGRWSQRYQVEEVTARSGRLMVREFAREDERRVMLVLDPFIGPPRADLGPLAAAEHEERFERAVSMAACIAWHFHEIDAVLQFRTDRFSTPMAPAGEIIYDALRELALIEAQTSVTGGAFLDELAGQQEIFKIILTCRPQHTIPTALWSSSYFVFIDAL